jgi:paraquat-inducible protein B
MATPDTPQSTSAVPQAVIDEEHKGFPVVWLLPLVAVIVGGWLIYKTISETGPSITITFITAEGIQAGKTRVKFRDVEVGKVDDVVFSDDLTRIIVHITMHPGAESYLTDRTRFWVVRPRIGASGVSGLSTLVSGAYIAMEPNQEGKQAKSFTGLEKPPVVTADLEGTSYRLRSKKLGGVSIGAPVYFRQFEVGEITEYRLAEDHGHVDISVFVRAPHDQYVREATRFWNAGGIDLKLDATGVQLEMQTVTSLLAGGIAFETLPRHADSPQAAEGTVFDLYDSHDASLEAPITIAYTFVARFSGSVRGLTVGAPVEFRGIRVGTVKSIELGFDPRLSDTSVPVVLIDLEPERLAGFADIDLGDEATRREQEDLEQHMVRHIEESVQKRGLRARLETGNLVTGALYVDLEYFPDAEPVVLSQTSEYPEIPTLPNPLEGILIGFNKLIDKLEAARLEDTLISLNELMASTNQLVGTIDQRAPTLATELETTLKEARATLSTLRAMASTDGEIGNELYNALAEITAAARSIRVMSEYLERHPEALIKGKAGNP